MTIKTDDPEQITMDKSAIDKVAAEMKLAKVRRQDECFLEVMELLGRYSDLNIAEASGVLLRAVAIGVIQANPRVQAEAHRASLRVAKLVPRYVNDEWGGKGHQSLLASKSREVN